MEELPREKMLQVERPAEMCLVAGAVDRKEVLAAGGRGGPQDLGRLVRPRRGPTLTYRRCSLLLQPGSTQAPLPPLFRVQEGWYSYHAPPSPSENGQRLYPAVAAEAAPALPPRPQRPSKTQPGVRLRQQWLLFPEADCLSRGLWTGGTECTSSWVPLLLPTWITRSESAPRSKRLRERPPVEQQYRELAGVGP